jgi:hypothetical protein
MICLLQKIEISWVNENWLKQAIASAFAMIPLDKRKGRSRLAPKLSLNRPGQTKDCQSDPFQGPKGKLQSGEAQC